mmetsp:Transcript_8548/g.12416  ORF Transcript_8548/g.12416 Transcript_8548/m.12416 type:complete len:450 (+) Transcript_8548:176-1525(+)|eukprot:CAMPEP_0195511226 /NCGR_PEP_ID=MMETSP0794_2-20130614/3619_1 /TAXON_ID=515487 /ORGANISM="Stephanopyxis turris, Strain CCMP 815" /LENGTH=449 /DNA_ID=CAMNT_0040638783 /DNA_START=176 /DNA_END=1525 /DNA_ORIENTATION=+
MNQTKSYGLDEINVNLDTINVNFPLIITPRWDCSLDFLTNFMEKNRSWVQQMITSYGAVLVRGFDIDTCPDFEKAVLSLQPVLDDIYRGTSPRGCMPNTKFTFSAAEVPTNYPIAQHCEMSFLPAVPRQLFFGCMKPSESAGGETALCDFRVVYNEMNPKLREKLLTKKIKYVRTHSIVGEKYTHDVAAMLGWPEMFGTSSKDEVERLVKEENGSPVQWVGPNKDTFRQEWVDEPFQLHPTSNEPVWFNHIQTFHWTTFAAELWFSFCRIKDIRLLIKCIIVIINSVIKYAILGYQMNLHVCFGDGEPISFWEMREIRRAVHRNTVLYRWQKGDICCIDNFSTSHGRQPTYDKGRKVVVAWAETLVKRNALTSATADIQAATQDQFKITGYDTVVKNSQEVQTAETTLTSDDAQDLKDAFNEQQFGENLQDAFKRTDLQALYTEIFKKE